jgi:hypothetical protein
MAKANKKQEDKKSPKEASDTFHDIVKASVQPPPEAITLLKRNRLKRKKGNALTYQKI